MTANQWTYVIASLAMMFVVVELLRGGKLREKYAVAWSAIAAMFLIFALLPVIPRTISIWLGFELPSNFVLALVNALVLAMLLQLAIAVGKLEKQNQTLAEHIALLSQDIRDEKIADSDVYRSTRKDQDDE